MDVEIGELEKYWHRYEAWCEANGLTTDFSDYLIWLDDQDLDAGQND